MGVYDASNDDQLDRSNSHKGYKARDDGRLRAKSDLAVPSAESRRGQRA